MHYGLSTLIEFGLQTIRSPDNNTIIVKANHYGFWQTDQNLIKVTLSVFVPLVGPLTGDQVTLGQIIESEGETMTQVASKYKEFFQVYGVGVLVLKELLSRYKAKNLLSLSLLKQ